jgi:hypothetical protein
MGSIDGLDNLMIARRLMQHAERAARRKAGEVVDEMSLKEEMEADQALLSPEASSIDKTQAAVTPNTNKVEQQSVNLADLIQRLHDLENGQGQTATGGAQRTTVQAIQKETLEIEINFDANTPVEGLVVRDKNLAETDRYRFEFSDNTTLTIVDKWAKKSTRIWGDPHIDLSDEEGQNNGDFKDLKGSDAQTTFMLLDGTRLTISAKDSGLIQEVDIFKGSQHVHGLGQDAKNLTAENERFSTPVTTDAATAQHSVQLGDVVYAGGDGNDWFAKSGQLVWGHNNPNMMYSRPGPTLSFQVRHTIESQITVEHQLDQKV